MKQALISVSDKTDLIPLAKSLIAADYSILSTGGTLKVLKAHDIPARAVSDYTEFPEILEGRVKTLHPKIHGGLLARRDNKEDMDTLKQHAINTLDMVVVNLYPFEATIQKEGITHSEAIEQIDIGGPSMLRSAAKNMASVTVITDIADYEVVMNELKTSGKTKETTRKKLAQKVFALTARYDLMIANYLGNTQTLNDKFTLKETLRYGENPHQQAFLYQSESHDPYSLLSANVLSGKQLSYNNIQDANAAITVLAEFKAPTAVAVKHMNPCGVASADTLLEAYRLAHQSDPVSIFGGIVALNQEVSIELAQELSNTFLEIIIAPSFEADALSHLKQKKNLRLLTLDMSQPSTTKKQITSINGGLLVQDVDDGVLTPSETEVVTDLVPSSEELEEMLFAWHVVKHVKSNAIVLSKNNQTIGVGAGQMNRVGAAKIAFESAKNLGFKEDIILASDAFFPFSDIVELAKSYGVKAIIQPGGSMRDQDSIDACNKLGITMVFTRKRHFKH